MERLRREQAAGTARASREQQFTFAWQWRRLHDYAHSRGVYLFGDVPFYVAPDSAEAWANREPVPAGCDRQAHRSGGRAAGLFFRSWGSCGAIRCMPGTDAPRWLPVLALAHPHQLERVDLLRIDHFRALAAHWAVPAGSAGCAQRQLAALVRSRAAAIPEGADWRICRWWPRIWASSHRMSRRCAATSAWPGMRVMQFGFDGTGDNLHLPHMYERLERGVHRDA